jgi:hypothetical protein
MNGWYVKSLSLLMKQLSNIIVGSPFLLQSLPILFLFNWSLIGIEAAAVESPFFSSHCNSSLFNWSLIGIEAAAVECESPFDFKDNH